MEKADRNVGELASRLGKWSRALRAQGMPGDRSKRSQADVATAAGVSTATISAFERGGQPAGTSNPHLDVLVGVARAHGISVADFVALAETPWQVGINGVVGRVAEGVAVSPRKIEYLRREIMEDMHDRKDPTPVRREAPSLEALSLHGGATSGAYLQAVRNVEFMAELASEIVEELRAVSVAH